MSTHQAHATPRSSLSPSPATPTWAPPRSPLPPHRLAMLANALGVSTPLPAYHGSYSFSSSTPNLTMPLLSSPSSASSTINDQPRRSPTPSTFSSAWSTTTSGPTSKYLLHVVPPVDLPHDPDAADELTMPSSSASGYHTQFRRGVMVPLHQSLGAQLAAIAREYALPSTTGMVLYLILGSSDGFPDEPGPRISDEIWKHVWIKVLKAERDEYSSMRPHSPSSLLSPTHPPPPSNQLRALMSARNMDVGQSFHNLPTPSPSTPSSISGTRMHMGRFNGRTASPPAAMPARSDSLSSVSSANSLQSEPMPRRGSEASQTDPDLLSLDLPGLSSPSIVPILAKVEFDIDKRKATWYEPWLRSRKYNQQKRKTSTVTGSPTSEAGAGIEGHDQDSPEKRPPLHLELVNMRNGAPSPSFLTAKPSEPEAQGYQALEASDVEQEDAADDASDYGDEEEADADPTMRQNGQDPLQEVFGTDAQAWEEIRAEREEEEDDGPDSRRTTIRRTVRQSNAASNIVDLALTAGQVSELPEPGAESDEEDKGKDQDGDEVMELLNKMSQSQLASPPRPAVGSPRSPPEGVEDSPGRKRSESSGLRRNHVPPPLTLNTHDTPASAPDVVLTGTSSDGSSRLPYITGNSESPATASELEVEQEPVAKMATPVEEKRGGAFYEELELGLEPSLEVEESGFDENDPNDRRRSQFIMKAKLDEIERALQSLSPRAMKPTLPSEGSASTSARSNSLSASSALGPAAEISLNSPLQGEPAKSWDATRTNATLRSTSISSFSPAMSFAQEEEVPQWPAVPFSQLRSDTPQSDDGGSEGPGSPPPPRLAINGVSSDMPRVPPRLGRRGGSHDMSDESKRRARDEDTELYNAVPLSAMPARSFDSPVIPLSPDPFGRFSSSMSSSPGSSSDQRLSYASISDSGTTTPQPGEMEFAPHTRSGLRQSSRFSADSADEAMGAKSGGKDLSSRMSVKSIKKLWRKSNKSSITSINKSEKSISPGPPSPWPKDGNQGFEQQMDLPPVPRSPNPQQMLNGGQHSRGHSGQQSDLAAGFSFPAVPANDPSPRSSPRPSMSASRPGTSMSGTLPNGQTSPQMATVPVPGSPPHEEKKVGRMKSILKSRKPSNAALLPPTPMSANGSGSDGGSGSERSAGPGEPKRKRRPSLFEAATAVMKGGNSTAHNPTNSVAALPPSPNLPEQYRASQVRIEEAGARQSLHRRESSGRSLGPGPPAGPRPPSLPVTTSPPAPAPQTLLQGQTSPRPSYDSSFDTSEFEMVSPHLGANGLPMSQTYHGDSYVHE